MPRKDSRKAERIYSAEAVGRRKRAGCKLVIGLPSELQGSQLLTRDASQTMFDTGSTQEVNRDLPHFASFPSAIHSSLWFEFKSPL